MSIFALINDQFLSAINWGFVSIRKLTAHQHFRRFSKKSQKLPTEKSFHKTERVMMIETFLTNNITWFLNVFSTIKFAKLWIFNENFVVENDYYTEIVCQISWNFRTLTIWFFFLYNLKKIKISANFWRRYFYFIT